MSSDQKSIPLNPVKAGYKTLTTATTEALRDAIQQGKYPPTSQLPGELELIRMLGISRTTLREALRVLEEQRIIIRRRGLGTFVSARSIRKDLSNNFGITDMIRQANFTPGTMETDLITEKASSTVADALNLERGTSLVVLERVRTADGVPVVFSRDITTAEILGKRALEMIQSNQLSLYDYLDQNLNIKITHGQARLKPMLASGEIAQKLKVKAGSPLLCMEQTDYDNQDRPVVYSIEYHTPEAFEFVIIRRGPK